MEGWRCYETVLELEGGMNLALGIWFLMWMGWLIDMYDWDLDWDQIPTSYVPGMARLLISIEEGYTSG